MELEPEQPLVTIGIPLYNHARFVRQCVESVLDQSYSNLQVIVIDDGSTDGSFGVLRELASERKDSRLEISSRDNKGMCNTLNEIAERAQGEYISMLGSDDYWMPEKIEDQVRYLEKHPEHILVHSNSIKVDSCGIEIKKIDYSEKENSGNLFEALIYKRGGINTPSHLYRTRVFEDIGFYDPDFRFEDTDFWLRLTKAHEVGFLNRYHTYYRWHSENFSQRKNQLSAYNRDLEAIYRKNISDRNLLKYALTRLHKKSLLRSLKVFDLREFFYYLQQYIRSSSIRT